eukprot:2526975-Alexandrium_andersonii.AAC.1
MVSEGAGEPPPPPASFETRSHAQNGDGAPHCRVSPALQDVPPVGSDVQEQLALEDQQQDD